MSKNQKAIHGGGKLKIVHWYVLALSALLTIFAWLYSKQQLETKIEYQFEREVERVVELIQERMDKYEEALLAGVAFHYANNNKVNYSQWKTYSSSLAINTRYPGINGIGVIHKVNRSELKNYLEAERAFRSNYNTHPIHEHNPLYPISYIEPFEGNEKAIGLDMAHELNRLTAIEKSRDTGKSQITGPIVLVQDEGKTPGFLFYSPIYNKQNLNAIRERRENFYGAVYAPFVVKKLMLGTLRAESRNVTLQINDTGVTLYNENIIENPEYDIEPLYKLSKTLDFYGRKWSFDIQSALSFHNSVNHSQPIVILIAGLFIDSMLFFIFLTIAKGHEHAVKYAEETTLDLRETNENLKLAQQKAQKATQAKSKFLANISHELRTPLNSILGFSKRLLTKLNPNLTEQEIDALSTIERNAKHLISLINDLLDFSEMESGKVYLSRSNFDMIALITEVLEYLEPLAAGKNIELLANFEPNSLMVNADRKRIMQIMINLLSNAIKYTEAGKIEINLDSGTNFEEPLILSVKDTGIGIAEDELETIFENFSRADTAKNSNIRGTGLGLPITKDLLTLHGGSISVISTLGKGSEFIVKLPIKINPSLASGETTQC